MSGSPQIIQNNIDNKQYLYPDQVQNLMVEGVSLEGNQVQGFLMNPQMWNEVVGEFMFVPQGVVGDEEAEFIRIGKRFEDAKQVTLGGQVYHEIPLDTPTSLKDLNQWLTVDKTMRGRGKDIDYMYQVARQSPVDTELAAGIGQNTALVTAIKTYYKETQPTTPADYGSGGVIR